jgi:hypothetical protein
LILYSNLIVGVWKKKIEQFASPFAHVCIHT